VQADVVSADPNDAKLLASPTKDATLLNASSENSPNSQIDQIEEKVR
jgi:hypothetical protein